MTWVGGTLCQVPLCSGKKGPAHAVTQNHRVLANPSAMQLT